MQKILLKNNIETRKQYEKDYTDLYEKYKHDKEREPEVPKSHFLLDLKKGIRLDPNDIWGIKEKVNYLFRLNTLL